MCWITSIVRVVVHLCVCWSTPSHLLLVASINNYICAEWHKTMLTWLFACNLMLDDTWTLISPVQSTNSLGAVLTPHLEFCQRLSVLCFIYIRRRQTHLFSCTISRLSATRDKKMLISAGGIACHAFSSRHLALTTRLGLIRGRKRMKLLCGFPQVYPLLPPSPSFLPRPLPFLSCIGVKSPHTTPLPLSPPIPLSSILDGAPSKMEGHSNTSKMATATAATAAIAAVK